MSNMRDKIICVEELKCRAEKLEKARDTYRKEGGKTIFSVYTSSGHDNYTLELSKQSTEKIFGVLIDEYNEQVKQIKKDIIKDFDLLIIC